MEEVSKVDQNKKSFSPRLESTTTLGQKGTILGWMERVTGRHNALSLSSCCHWTNTGRQRATFS
jgi:hypothetical protein